jgi:hypothetical protein
MKLNDETSLICVNANLQLKSGIVLGLLTCGEDRRCAAQQHPPHCTIVPNQFVSGRMGDRFAFAGNLTDAPVPERIKQIREGPMTTAGQAFLFAGEVFCLSFALIALVYFAERLRSDFLDP